MNLIKTHTKALTIAAGATAALAGLFLLFKKATKGDQIHEEILLQETGPILTEINRLVLVKELKVEYQEEFLSVSTITKILGAALKFAAPRFLAATQRFRKLRRNLRDSPDEYSHLCAEHSVYVDELLTQTQDEILKELGISEDVWDESNKYYYLTQGRQDLIALFMSLPHHLKMNIPPGKELSAEEFKEILQMQIKLLKKEAKNINDLIALLGEAEKASEVIQNKINDEIFDEFGVEEEDTLAAVKTLKNDPEIQKLLIEFQRVSVELEPQAEAAEADGYDPSEMGMGYE